MRSVVWFRVAAALTLLFAAGHTYGFLAFHPLSMEGRAVWDAMNSVRLVEGNSTFTYGGFYVGFGLFISVFQIFMAWLAWRLGSMVQRGIEEARILAWGMLALQVIGVGLSLRYFAMGPAVLSGLTAVCLALGALSMHASVRANVVEPLRDPG